MIAPRWFLYCGLAFQGLVLVVTFFKSKALFLSCVFWFLFLACQLFVFWPASFILPILLYALLSYLITGTLPFKAWFARGKIDRASIVLSAVTAIAASSSLILWVFLSNPDLSDLYLMVPTNSLLVVAIVGLLFSVFNSIWEEITFKGMLWDSSMGVFKNAAAVIVFQGILFGLVHLHGFPRGWIGAGLAAIYGMALGVLKHRTKGLLLPMVVHFFADATIFVILGLKILDSVTKLSAG
jgi:membrane protease YdiL (CAAX protease family)